MSRKLSFLFLYCFLLVTLVLFHAKPDTPSLDVQPGQHTRISYGPHSVDEHQNPKGIIPTGVKAESKVVTYPADIPQGTIGVVDSQQVDNPYDNIFHIYVPETISSEKIVRLRYKLYGVSSHIGIARSINDAQALGGQFVQVSHDWSLQTEILAPETLRKGDNVIRFGLPRNATYHYKVKDVSLSIENAKRISEAIIVNQPDLSYYGDQAYIKGVLQIQENHTAVKVYCDGEPISIYHNEFEVVLKAPSNKPVVFTGHFKAVLSSGTILAKTVSFTHQVTTYQQYHVRDKGITNEKWFERGKAFDLLLSKDSIKTALKIPFNALAHDRLISITALRDVDLPPLNADMVNVTQGAPGFRFLPHGSKFSIDAKLLMPFDSSLIPEGYTKADIRTYYFNENTRSWEALPLDTVLANEGWVATRTTHFTDMINGIIKVPESPQTQGYTPTSIKDLKAADPSSGITLINPPAASSMGGAALEFPLKLPSGRQGVQPTLTLQYNHQSGNSWVGYGWSLSISSVGIETRWGAPRYDRDLETETYTLNGQQLAPITYRGALKPRTADKKFTFRVEGAFNRIIRHGNSPTNYWWEVTAKDGMRNFYGGTPTTGLNDNAVLKNDAGNIGHWALVETRSPDDNFVHYEYDLVRSTGLKDGSVPGKQLYLSRIRYTGHGITDGAYAVELIRDSQLGEPPRKDVEINGILGFKMVSADRLRKINISFQDQPIRSYEFLYKDGAFYKSLLQEVRELDASGTLFYAHKFSYYDDVAAEQGYKPLTAVEDWHPGSDNIRGDILNSINGFSGEGSALSTSKSSNSNGGLTLTIGSTFGGLWSKTLSAGGTFSYGEDNVEGLVSLIDINGDGRPDKVFKKDNGLFYRPNLGNAVLGFGEARAVSGITNFSTSRTRNVSWGFQIVPYVAFIGYNSSRSTSTTPTYFSDFNGDGLMDIASNGQVYFNHLNSNGDPEFLLNSTLTPNPIQQGGQVDQAFFTKDVALQAQQEKQFPLQDVVRFWEAPFDGVVKIDAPIKLLQKSNQSGVVSAKKDGVKASIQLRSTVIWSTQIAPTDFTAKVPTGVDNLTVKKGNRIYFHLKSIYNGEDDMVQWDPAIAYITPVTPTMDASGRQTSKYQASTDFILDNRSVTRLIKDGTIEINGSFSKRITSDTVVALIIKESNGKSTEVFRDAYSCSTLINKPFIISNVRVQSGDSLRFVLKSDTYIDRSALTWAPHFQYTAFTDNTPLINSKGEPTIEGFVVPDNMNYNEWLIPTPILSASRPDTVKIRPFITAAPAVSGELTFTVKGINQIYAKRMVPVVNGKAEASFKDILLIRQAGEPLYIEYTTADRNFGTRINQAKAILVKDSSYIDQNKKEVKLTLRDTVGAGLYTNPAQTFVGPMFRGWGQFAFKGDVSNPSLDESKLNLDEFNSYPDDPEFYKDSNNLRTIQDPSKTNFILLYANGKNGAWTGYDTAVSVATAQMSSSRLLLHDVSVDPLMAGASLSAISKTSFTETNSHSLGISVGISATVGHTEAKTTSTLDMMDMNGDRYPDIVNESSVQYTLPSGGLEGNSKFHGLGAPVNQGTSDGISLGGGFPAVSSGTSTGRGANNEQKQAFASIGLSGNTGTSNDETISTWMDVNGDGLPDKIYNNGTVALNLGYTFTAAENWGLTAIDKNGNSSEGAGFGVTIDAGSFQGGFGLSRGNGKTALSLQDINGDGLPDKIGLGASGLAVQLNTGNGFSDPVEWKNFTAITSNVSTGESMNAAYTIDIPIPPPPLPPVIKICINPAFSSGHGISRRLDQVMDIDGDGYPDLLHSENDGNLTVARSTIGRTNLLQKVERPLGGSFVLDYERIGTSYDMPQSKWVLKTVEVSDGVHGDGADITRTRFQYEGALYNRHEREFYGFRKVASEQLNTNASDMVYRRHIQLFLNTTYYTKGLLESEWLEDAAANRYTQTNNLYNVRQVADSSHYPALVQSEKLFYEGQTTPVRTSTQFGYDNLGNVTKIIDAGDGSQQDLVTADVTYHDLDNLYIKSIPSGITVRTAEGIKRKRTTAIDNQGNITRIQQFLADGRAANTDMEYDAYGNLSKITRPANYKEQRMWYSYEYDDAVHSYVTKVKDAFGYASSSTYDYRFGMVTSTVSMNAEPMRYEFDNSGRLVRITGPYELAAGKPYTIAQEYHPEAAVPYALTKHYDPEYNGDIITITFMDGLARPVQVKKQAALFRGKELEDDVRMIVSGRIVYDAFGRAEKTYYPTTEPTGNSTSTLSTTAGTLASTSTYDVQDRPTATVLADGATTKMAYSVAGQFLSTKTTDALNNSKENFTDVKGRNRSTKVYNGPDGTITTNFYYNALDELLHVIDTKGNATSYTYDNLGRKTSVQHPDAGLTEFSYDLAGNLLQKITAEIRQEIPEGGAIKYGYEYERITDIDYPRYYQNKVKYTYGGPGKGSRTGRLQLIEDASGGQEFYYGKLGEITKTIRTVLVTPIYSVTYVSEQQYDTWNRIKKMTYPDGEEVTYHYNKGGSLRSFEGNKLGNVYRYVDQVGYDQYEQRVYLRYGNGTETEYQYDPLRRRLLNLKAIAANGHAMLNNKYSYDAVSNILGVVNDVTADTGKLGGFAQYDYDYDNLYRLVKASGIYRGSNVQSGYSLEMSYDNLYNIRSKKMLDSLPQHCYSYTYNYQNAAPHQVTEVGASTYSYDANGNVLGNGISENFWDEENRLVAVLNHGLMSRYTYDANGERIIKSSGGIQGIWVNGAPAGTIKHNDNFTVYVSPYLVCRKESFTKHFYIESQRVVSKIGNGTFANISFPVSGLTAGGVNYAKRAELMERNMTAYYGSLGVSPGPPTDKNFWARPENNGIAPPVFVDSTASTVPAGWPSNPDVPRYGQPIYLDPAPGNDSVRAGYGFNGTGHSYEKNQYFYHPDHLGSTSYVTDALGAVNQHVEYSAFGEIFVEEHATSAATPYLFNAKERDEETGLYYYGARYYDSKLSLWLSLDPKREKYPNISPYNFLLSNPVKMIDPNGQEPDDFEKQWDDYKKSNPLSRTNEAIQQFKENELCSAGCIKQDNSFINNGASKDKTNVNYQIAKDMVKDKAKDMFFDAIKNAKPSQKTREFLNNLPIPGSKGSNWNNLKTLSKNLERATKIVGPILSIIDNPTDGTVSTGVSLTLQLFGITGLWGSGIGALFVPTELGNGELTPGDFKTMQAKQKMHPTTIPLNKLP